MRTGDAGRQLLAAPDGPMWSYEEAEEHAHGFLVQLSGNRDINFFSEDAVEHARLNAMMLLFNDEVLAVFETYLRRMPKPRADAWRELISGGVSAEVFGPLTLQEKLDERRLEAHIRSARNGRIVFALVVIALLGAIATAGFLYWEAFFQSTNERAGVLNFTPVTAPSNDAALQGGPPVVEAALTTSLDNSIAVLAGDAPLAERVVDAPGGSFPYPAGALGATLFQYAGSGHVLFVGPSGFVQQSCLRASVVTSALRPFDVVSHGPCAEPVGRPAIVGCLGSTALLLNLQVPNGAVELPEGGIGVAQSVRVQLIGSQEGYETLSLRSTISVGATDEVAVPRFGAVPGEELSFDLGNGKQGTCIITGDLSPQQSS